MSNLKPRWRRDKAKKRETWHLMHKGRVIAKVFALLKPGEYRYYIDEKRIPCITERFTLKDAKDEAMFRADW